MCCNSYWWNAKVGFPHSTINACTLFLSLIGKHSLMAKLFQMFCIALENIRVWCISSITASSDGAILKEDSKWFHWHTCARQRFLLWHHLHSALSCMVQMVFLTGWKAVTCRINSGWVKNVFNCERSILPKNQRMGLKWGTVGIYLKVNQGHREVP